MALNDYPIMLDVSSGDVVRDFFSNVDRGLPPVRQGDTLRVLFSCVRPNPNANSDPSRPWEFVAVPPNLRVGIGIVNSRPTLGTFSLTFEGDTTTALALDATAAAVAAALNDLAAIISAGGVTVTGPNGGPWQILFTSPGARGDITGNGDALYPSCLVTATTRRQGTVALAEIQSVFLELQAAAYTDSFTAFPGAAVQIQELQVGAEDVPAVQRVLLSPAPYGGTFTLTFDEETTGAIPYDATAEELQLALEALPSVAGDGKEINAADVLVRGASPTWDVTFRGALAGVQPLMTGNADGLQVATGRIGYLDLATEAVAHLLEGLSERSVTLEVEAPDEPITLLRAPVTLENDLLPNNPTMPPASEIYLTRTQSDARYLRIPFVTALTGGGADALDGQPTADGAMATGAMVITDVGDLAFWKLVVGTNAEDGHTYIRPDDYHAGTNARVWLRRL